MASREVTSSRLRAAQGEAVIHFCGIVQDPGGQWRAECSCGWHGVAKASAIAAAADAKEHKQQAAGAERKESA